MQNESVVYGCIKDSAYSQSMSLRSEANREALLSLPPAENRPLLSREMFAATDQNADIELHTEVVHFGASYFGIEYEWQVWTEQFEVLLRKMYWVTVTAHLETEMSGVHSFVWETPHEYHQPGNSDIQLRCEWLHDR
jgi:hypothetical protein